MEHGDSDGQVLQSASTSLAKDHHTMRIDPRFQRIRLSKIVEVSERARDLAPEFEKRTGKPFVFFQRGEVGGSPPPFLTADVQEAIAQGWTKYPKSGGEPAFKQAIVELLAKDGVTLEPANILATMGGQEGLQLLFSLLRGGTCAGFTPAWSCVFDNIFPYTDTTFVPVPLIAEQGWAIDFARLERVLPGIDSFYFNSPHNPTGRVFSRAEVERVVELCAKHNVLLIADEAYRDLVYVGEHVSPLSIPTKGDVVSVNTFSKSMAATGFRVGFTASRRKDLIASLIMGEYTQTAGVPTPLQHAFAKSLRRPERITWLESYGADMRQKREALVANLDPRLGATEPQGAFYCFIDLRPHAPGWTDGRRAEREAMERLLAAGIAVVPGSAFGESFAGYARLSFSTLSAPAVADGARRFGQTLLTGSESPVLSQVAS
jgi:aspartate aminotransferase